MSGGVNAIGNLQGKVDADNNLCVFVSGGSGTPGSPNTSVQFNNAGSFAGSSDLTFDDTTNVLTIGGYPLDANTYLPDFLSVVAPAGQGLYFASDADAPDSSGLYLAPSPDGVDLSAARVGVLTKTMTVAATLEDADTPPNAFFGVGTVISKTNAALPATFLGNGLASAMVFGTADGTTAVATVGTAHASSASLTVVGNGHADNEQAVYTGTLSVPIGTGFSQAAGPTGRAWFSDWQVLGPVAVQPDSLNGPTVWFQNNYNGDGADNPMAALNLVAGWGLGTGTHASADSYPVAQGLFIGGHSFNGAADRIGFTTGIQIGGTGSPWSPWASMVGTGINIRDYAVAGININNADATTAPSIIFDTFLQTAEMAGAPSAPAANGCRIYCVDNGGKTELLAIFNTGASQRIAIQP